MADEKYPIQKDPAYRAADIRRIQNEDPINAEESLNPVIEAVLECLQFLYLNRASLDGAGKVPSSQLPAMDFDKAGSAAAVASLLKEHTGDKSNPHGVTAAQVGAALEDHKHSAADVGALPLSGGAVIGKTVFSGGLALTEADSDPALPFFLGIEEPDNGGDVRRIAAGGVCAAIGAAALGHTHADKQDKVAAGTADLTAGSSALATGALYAVYE